MATTHTANLIDEMAGAGLSRSHAQRRLAQIGLGILHTLKNGTMTIPEAQNDLFNLPTYQAARRRRYDRKLAEFLEWGMELEDVAELAPDGLEASYDAMESLLEETIATSFGRDV